MSGQTIIKYGDVTLYRCLTKRVEQRPVLDSAGVSLKNWRFVISGVGYLHGFPSACAYHEVTGGTDYSDAAQAHKQARWRLPPQKTFTMAVGCTTTIASGNTLLHAEPMTSVTEPADLETAGQTWPEGRGLSNYDVDDGPRCLQFDVVHVSSNSIFRVEFTFEINVLQCDDDATATGNQNGVIAHRWSSADSLDGNLRTTRIYDGMLELATSQFSPHWFRYLVVPPLQYGMRREEMRFIASEDGKKLRYTIIDQSVAYSAPPPARRWHVEHTEASVKTDDGMVSTSQIAVNLEGPEDCNKGDLIILAMYVIAAKLQGSKPGEAPVPNAPILMNDVTITDITGDVKAVRASASCTRIPIAFKDDDAAAKGVALHVAGFNKVILAADLPAFAATYDPKRSADGRVGESPVYEGPVPLVGLFRCYLQSQCSDGGPINTRTNQLTYDLNDNPDYEPQIPVSAEIAPALDYDPPDYYSDSHKTSMYTTWQMESMYSTGTTRAAMPLSLPPYGSGGIDERESCAVTQQAFSQCRRVVRIVAERVGAWPEFPDFETLDGDATVEIEGTADAIPQKLLRAKLLGGTVTKSVNGEDVYRARAEAIYALLRAPTAIELLKFGLNKWSSGSTVSNPVLTNSDYDPAP